MTFLGYIYYIKINEKQKSENKNKLINLYNGIKLTKSVYRKLFNRIKLNFVII